MIGILNRVLRAGSWLFFGAAAILLASTFALQPFTWFVKSTGDPALQHLIGSDGFFPWPVAMAFALMRLYPWFIIVGLAGLVLRMLLGRLLLLRSTEVTAQIVDVRPTRLTVNGRRQMWLKLRLDDRAKPRDVTLRLIPGIGTAFYQGDLIRVQVSQADPDFVRYKGPASGRLWS